MQIFSIRLSADCAFGVMVDDNDRARSPRDIAAGSLLANEAGEICETTQSVYQPWMGWVRHHLPASKTLASVACGIQ